MQQSLISRNQENRALLDGITYLVGNADIIFNMPLAMTRNPFDEEIIEFLNDVSRIIMGLREAKAFPDVITLAFWMRKSSIMKLKERFMQEDENIHLGRGTAFHIAPSNVPVNYAYSLVAGLITGNANIVRIPSKDFAQVVIINNAINQALESHENIKPYICLIRYGKDQAINDLLSTLANTRIIWGGDQTIAEIRKSPLAPRAGEITFADRYSLAVIDSDEYLKIEDRAKVAEDFYNDTCLTDQNACTSPRVVIWMGSKIEAAKKDFWNNLHELVKKKYTFQPIQGINKLTSGYLAAAIWDGVKIEEHNDNLIIRIRISSIKDNLMDLKDNSGYFFEYDCKDILELKELCNDDKCQTVAYIGGKDMMKPLIRAGVKGIDRVVQVGKTMDFDLIWDGYNLYERLTRTIRMT